MQKQQRIDSVFQAIRNMDPDARPRAKSADAATLTSTLSSTTSSKKGANKRVAAREELQEEAAKRLCLSQQTKDSFTAEFPDIVVPAEFSHDLLPHYELTDEAVEVFLEFWIPYVSLADTVVRYGMGGERAKYLPMFSLLGSVAVIGDKKLDMEAVPRPIPQPQESDDIELNLSTSEILQLMKFIGFEETLDKGNVEFMTFADATTTKIEGIVEIKVVLLLGQALLEDTSKGSPVWQFFSEMVRALNRNSTHEPGEVWGALCDETAWYFGRARRVVAGGPVDLAIHPQLEFHKTRKFGTMQCVVETKKTLQFLFSLIHGRTAPKDHFTAACIGGAVKKVQQAARDAVAATISSYRTAVAGEQAVQFLDSCVEQYRSECAEKCIPATAQGFRAKYTFAQESAIAKYFDV